MTRKDTRYARKMDRREVRLTATERAARKARATARSRRRDYRHGGM